LYNKNILFHNNNGDIVEYKKYENIVKKYTPKEEKIGNCIRAFISGGLLGMLGNFLVDSYSYIFNITTKDASVIMIATLIFIACLLTSLGVFDNLVKIGKMGLIIPITGFAHAMQSSTLDYKNEGPIYGFGSNMFKLAGSVILYGISSAFIFGLIRYLLGGII
jgi:SpoVA protein.